VKYAEFVPGIIQDCTTTMWVSLNLSYCQAFSPSLISALWPNGPFTLDNTGGPSSGKYGRTPCLHLVGR
jgi:hypothetical protein